MKASQDNDIRYEVIRSRRSTADIIIERDGSVLGPRPGRGRPTSKIEDIVE